MAERVIDLAPVTETRLPMLVAAAVEGAAADDVTPPITAGPAWTEVRVTWLRAFHRDRHQGLTGPRREATWAVVDVGGAGPERVVGGIRLQGTDDPEVLVTGIWLVRAVRGKGIGRQAVRLALDRARDAGALLVRADTTADNAAAVGLLRSSGAVVTVVGAAVTAELPVGHPRPS